MVSKIPIIRSFWGVTDYSRLEILQHPVFGNELVCVWGKENESMFKSLGYKTHLMSEYPTDPRYSTVETQYYHKLETLVVAGQLYEEFIMLDWDSFLVRPLDDRFYDSLRNGNEVQIPLYAYPDEDGIGLLNRMNHISNRRYRIKISDDLKFFFKGQESQLRLHSWKKDGMLISPNFNFCYSRRPNFGAELIKAGLDNSIKYCVEENAMFQWANCQLDEYIKMFEPIVVQGTSDDTRTILYGWDWQNDPVYVFNKYINQIKPKEIYLKHI